MVLVVAACGGGAPASVSTAAAEDTGDVAGFAVTEIALGGRVLTVAVADEPALRSQGLRGVTDLGSLDGMLFDLGDEDFVSFTMADTLIPLDLWLFDTEGGLVESFPMEPCRSEPCPSHPSSQPVRWALETPKGALDLEGDLELP